jgi:hypothetical protein
MGFDGFRRNWFRQIGFIEMGFTEKCVNRFCGGLLYRIRSVNGFCRNTKEAALRMPGTIPEKKSSMDLDE